MSRNEESNPIRIPRGPAEIPVDHDLDIEDTIFSHGCDIRLMKRRIHELRKNIRHMQTAMLYMAMYMLLWMVGWGFGWW